MIVDIQIKVNTRTVELRRLLQTLEDTCLEIIVAIKNNRHNIRYDIYDYCKNKIGFYSISPDENFLEKLPEDWGM